MFVKNSIDYILSQCKSFGLKYVILIRNLSMHMFALESYLPLSLLLM